MTTKVTAKEARKLAWHKTLSEQATEKGFFREVGSMHNAVYIPHDGALGRTLVVAFDNLNDLRQDPNRLPWAVDFINAQGWSSLGFVAHGPTWYRDEAVFDFFENLKSEGFFDQFDRVVFYGTSMGGYAACAFSAACPGSTVLAINPQACMDRERAGWDKRYKKSWRHNYSSRFGYAPDMVADAEKVWLFYDSRLAEDAMHASLFQSENVIKMGCPLMGHGMLTVWRDMGVLTKIVRECINGTATRISMRQLLRARHTSSIYQRYLLTHLTDTKRHALKARLCKYVVAQRHAPHFKNALEAQELAFAEG